MDAVTVSSRRCLGAARHASRTLGRVRWACFQFDVRAGAVDDNVAEVEHGLREARRAHASLVVLPEMWPTSFLEADAFDEAVLARSQRAVEHVCRLANESGIVVTGSAFAPGTLRPRNRWHVLADGRVAAAHDKIHLFRPTAEDAGFECGDGPPACAETAAGRIGGVVCYDLRFPEPARHLFRAGAQVLAVSSQWAAARAAHLDALVAGRAVEAQAFVASCNRTGTAFVGRRRAEIEYPGASRIVDPHGCVLARGGAGRELVVADVDLELVRELRARVPVAKDDRPDVYARWN